MAWGGKGGQVDRTRKTGKSTTVRAATDHKNRKKQPSQKRTPDSPEKTKTWWDKNKETVIDSLESGSKVAGHMADKHKEANSGLTSSSAYGDFGAGQSYDTTPHTATRKLNKKTDNWEY